MYTWDEGGLRIFLYKELNKKKLKEKEKEIDKDL